MIRLLRTATFVTVVPLLMGCDSGGLTIVPEVEQTFGFESSLTPWTGVTEAGQGGTAEVAVSSEESSTGSSSAKLMIDDDTGAGSAILTRSFELEPNRAYRLDLSYDFGSSDGGAGTPWSVVADLGSTMPTGASDLSVVGTTEISGQGVVFETRTLTLNAVAGPDGDLWVSLGVAQESGGTRSFFLDEVEVVLTRR